MLGRITPIVFAACVALPAYAQTAAPGDQAGPSAGAQAMGTLTSGTLLDMRARDPEGQELGSVENLVIDPQSGQVTHLVVSVGGFLGIGDKQVAIPWEDANLEQQAVVLEVTRDELEAAQVFKEQAAAVPAAEPPAGTAPPPAETPPAGPATGNGARAPADSGR